MNNIVKHSEATEAKITVSLNGDELKTVIEDNGKGFAVPEVSGKGGFGLTGIAERVRMLGGEHYVESASGAGTTISIVIKTAGNDNNRLRP